jgi:MFS family permease
MVVLDTTILNVALPHIQRALGFSGSGLEWVVNAYALSFGGLLLLGGRAGGLLGRCRVFVARLVLFSAASLVGGFATSQGWLLAARAVQGIGSVMIAPTALALIVTTFAVRAGRVGPPSRPVRFGRRGRRHRRGGVAGLRSVQRGHRPARRLALADPKVVASLAAAAVLLAGFMVIEARSAHVLTPLRIFADCVTGGVLIALAARLAAEH